MTPCAGSGQISVCDRRASAQPGSPRLTVSAAFGEVGQGLGLEVGRIEYAGYRPRARFTQAVPRPAGSAPSTSEGWAATSVASRGRHSIARAYVCALAAAQDSDDQPGATGLAPSLNPPGTSGDSICRAWSPSPHRCYGCRCSCLRCCLSAVCRRCFMYLGWPATVAVGLLQATSLLFLVTAATIGMQVGTISSVTGAALVVPASCLL